MKKLAALLALILWSISTAGSASSAMTVMCVEKSGSITFEYSLGSRCLDQEEAKVSASTDDAAFNIASCPSCTDSSLSAPTATASIAAKSLSDIAALSPVPTLAAPVLFHINGLRAPPNGASPLVRSSYLAQRETIVILQ